MEKWQGNESIAGNRGVKGNIEVIRSWLDARDQPPILPVKYEELHADLVLQFRLVLGHFRMDVNDRLVRSIVSGNRVERLATGKWFWMYQSHESQEDPSSHYRKGITGDWRNY
jgi:hypothetical protein